MASSCNVLQETASSAASTLFGTKRISPKLNSTASVEYSKKAVLTIEKSIPSSTKQLKGTLIVVQALSFASVAAGKTLLIATSPRHGHSQCIDSVKLSGAVDFISISNWTVASAFT